MIKSAQDWDLRRRHIYIYLEAILFIYLFRRGAPHLDCGYTDFSSGPAAVNLFPFLLLGPDEAAVFLDCELLFIVFLQVPRRLC